MMMMMTIKNAGVENAGVENTGMPSFPLPRFQRPRSEIDYPDELYTYFNPLMFTFTWSCGGADSETQWVVIS